MVVDDTPANLQLLQKMLQTGGYRVVVFPSGKLAMSAAARNQPDLILLDVTMPEMDGYEVCEQFKADAQLKDIPVIFISALNDISDKVRAFAVGGVDYVTKPFRIEEVLARVRTHLSLCAARRELKKQNEILQENIHLREVVEQISRHDLKGPMTAFINVPEMLMSASNLEPDQRELLELLSKSARRLLDMIHRSLDLYKMEVGTYQYTPVMVNILRVVRDVFRELKGLAERKNLTFKLQLDEQPVKEGAVYEISGEEFLFFSIFSNLIKNAVEASPADGVVTVSLTTTVRPTVSIHNFGVIPEQIRSRLFERYVTFGKERGTGLGIFSAHLMIKTMSGELSFTSDEAHGTTMNVIMNPAPPAPKN